MFLTKDGITCEVYLPLEIQRLKGLGYLEVEPEEEASKPAPKKASAPKPSPKVKEK